MGPFLGRLELKQQFSFGHQIKPLLWLSEHFIFPLEFELFCQIAPAHLAEMAGQQAKFVRGCRQRFFPDAEKLMDLFCEIARVLEPDELHAAAAHREAGGKSLSIFF